MSASPLPLRPPPDEAGRPSPPPHQPERFVDEVAALLAQEIRLILTEADRLLPATPPWYALVCAAQWPATPPDQGLAALCETLDLDAEPLFLRTPEAMHHASGPHLIALAGVPRHQLGVLARHLGQAAANRALTLFNSTVPEAELQAHLRGWMNGRLGDGSEVLWRYFDGRMGTALLQALPEDRLGAFMQPFRSWRGWDWVHRPQALKGPVRQSFQAPSGPLSIDVELMARLTAVSDLHFLINEIDTAQPPGWRIAPALRHDIVQRQLDAAAAVFDALKFPRTAAHQKVLIWYALKRLPNAWHDEHFLVRIRQEIAHARSLDVLTTGVLGTHKAVSGLGEAALAVLHRQFVERLAERIRTDHAG